MSTFEPSRQMRRMQIVALLLLVASGIVNYLDRVLARQRWVCCCRHSS